jgi:hypothetical protein
LPASDIQESEVKNQKTDFEINFENDEKDKKANEIAEVEDDFDDLDFDDFDDQDLEGINDEIEDDFGGMGLDDAAQKKEAVKAAEPEVEEPEVAMNASNLTGGLRGLRNRSRNKKITE